MENEQVKRVQREAQRSLGRDTRSTPQLEVKRELLSSIGLFIDTGLLGLGLEPLQVLRWLTVWKSL